MTVLTDEQRKAVAAIEGGETFALHGLAGTGKTTAAAHMAAFRPGAYLCALTGKAAGVLRDKTGSEATTVHRPFYQFVRSVAHEDEPMRLEFRPAHALGSLTGKAPLLDESSMSRPQGRRPISWRPESRRSDRRPGTAAANQRRSIPHPR